MARHVPSFGDPGPLTVRPGASFLRTARAFQAAMPFTVALSSMVLLGSHDSARWAYISGDRERAAVGMAMLCTWPGTPSVLYGDEIGLGPSATWDVTTRVPFPWQSESTWDHGIFDTYRELIELRRTLPALARGGMRWVSAGDDHLVWLRESNDQAILVHIARGAHAPDKVAIDRLGFTSSERIASSEAATYNGAKTPVLAANGAGWQILQLSIA